MAACIALLCIHGRPLYRLAALHNIMILFLLFLAGAVGVPVGRRSVGDGRTVSWRTTVQENQHGFLGGGTQGGLGGGGALGVTQTKFVMIHQI